MLLKLRVVAMNSRNVINGKMRDIVLSFRTLCNTIAVKHVEPVDFYHVSNYKPIFYFRLENNISLILIELLIFRYSQYCFYFQHVIKKVRLSKTMITQILMHLHSVSNFYLPFFILPYTNNSKTYINFDQQIFFFPVCGEGKKKAEINTNTTESRDKRETSRNKREEIETLDR